ncbi:MAG: iron chelate uptake ABC transporter family permease subunit [Nesterenkonia sp.]|nr:iron chelate uptake ABC transporter family permease subunit [Nesterenkonia sp.]
MTTTLHSRARTEARPEARPETRAETRGDTGNTGDGARTRLTARRRDLRTPIVTLVLTVTALALAWWGLNSGTSQMTTADTLDALLGRADEGTARVILDWRLPRVVFTLLGGAALAMAGAVFQSMTRNPLGSPDVIGFSTGAYTGALVVAVAGTAGALATPLGAVAGGLGTGAAVYLLARRRGLNGGGLSGMRIIVVGIGVSILLGSVNTYLITTMDLEAAMSVATWGAGSVNDITWTHVVPLTLALAVLGPVMLAHGREMTLMEMGDDAAHGLGVRLERVRLVMFAAGILLVAVVTAASGPIAFVALVAPQLALRLTRSGSVSLLPAAAMGAALLTGADLLARWEAVPADLPVGVVTLCLGGAYLVWLLTTMGRRTA